MITVKVGKTQHIVQDRDRRKGEKWVTKCYCGKEATAKLDFHTVPPSCTTCLKLCLNDAVKKKAKSMDTADYNRKICSSLAYTLSSLFDRHSCRNNNGEAETGAYTFMDYSVWSVSHIFYNLNHYLYYNANSDYRGIWALNRRSIKFLDAGCGIGNILTLAQGFHMAGEYHGIEYFKHTAERATLFLGLDKIKNHKNRERHDKFKLIQDNILTFNNYGDYDIIYYYCPLEDKRLQARFEERVEDQMKVGSILIPILKQSRVVLKDYRFQELDISRTSANPIYMKIKEGKRRSSDISRLDKKIHNSCPEIEENIQNIIKNNGAFL